MTSFVDLEHHSEKVGLQHPDLGSLLQLCYLADHHLSTGRPVTQEMGRIVMAAYDGYDWRLSSDIQKLIGAVTIQA
jgi:hypothetical protein